MERQAVMQPVAPADRRSNRPRGFTLVELLAVIMIIALLAAIVTPAVMKSMSTARAAAVKTEIDLLHMALMNYKNEYGGFPPSDMRGLWNGSAVNTGHPAYKHLQKIFPRIAERTAGGTDSPYYWMAQMSPAQALVFWLQGFFDNPRYPLTNDGNPLSASTPRAGTANGNRTKLFDFDESRLYAAGLYWQPTSPAGSPISAQRFSTRGEAKTAFPNNNEDAFAREYPVYFPNQANAGLPYVYFPNTSYCSVPSGNVSERIGPAAPSASPDLYYTATSLNGDSAAVAPYFNSLNCTTASQYSWAQLHMNPDTFQLIAAGADGTYGELVAGFPLDAVVDASGSPATFSHSSYSHGPFRSVKNRDGSNPGHEDNITNFAGGRLREAAEKLSQ